MLSKREKLLIYPWEQRRFKDHRVKVRDALPVIDDTPPQIRQHVQTKLKKNQNEEDRREKILKDNFSLMQRLSVIMKVNRLDNYWKKPLPNFHHKVDLYVPREACKLVKPQVKLRDDINDSISTSMEDGLNDRYNRCTACQFRKNMFRETTVLPVL